MGLPNDVGDSGKPRGPLSLCVQAVEKPSRGPSIGRPGCLLGAIFGGGAAAASIAALIAAWAQLYCVGKDDFGFPCMCILLGCPYVCVGAVLGIVLTKVADTSRGAMRGAKYGAYLGGLFGLLFCFSEMWPLAIVIVAASTALFAFVGVVCVETGRPLPNREDSQG